MRDIDSVDILLVEDSLTTTAMVKHWLEDGLSVPHGLTTAGKLADALTILRRQHVDLVILDLNLPDSEGLDTFTKLHEQTNGIPIVIMSGESDEQLALTAVREGAQDYIVKGSFSGANPITRPVQFAIERAHHQQTQRELQAAQSQLNIARTIQQEMLPTTPPEIPGFEVAGRCEPAESVAGDYFDFFPISGDKWGVLIGDVCGHGLGPALHMVATRGALRALMNTFADTATITTRTNKIVHHDTRHGRFVTLLFLILDAGQNQLHYSSAGHPGFLLDSEGNLRQTLNSDQPPLGISDDQAYATYATSLNPGDVAVLATDGITEAQAPNNSTFGEERLLAIVKQHINRSASEIVGEVFNAVRSFCGPHVHKDDLTVVIVKCLG